MRPCVSLLSAQNENEAMGNLMLDLYNKESQFNNMEFQCKDDFLMYGKYNSETIKAKQNP